TVHLKARRVAGCAQQATPQQTATKGSADARLTPSRVGGGGAFQVMRCTLAASLQLEYYACPRRSDSPMATSHSGAPLDGLLKIVLAQGGDRLLLETDKMPLAKKGESPLRLTVPPTSNSMLCVLCGEMASAMPSHDADAACTFAYQLGGENFQVHISGSLREGGSASVLIQKASSPHEDETIDHEERRSRVTTLSIEERSSRGTPHSPQEHSPSRVTLVEQDTSPSPDWRRLIDEAIALEASDLHL